MHVSVIYVRIVLVGFKRYWSLFRGTGRFEPLLTSVGRTLVTRATEFSVLQAECHVQNVKTLIFHGWLMVLIVIYPQKPFNLW